MKITIIAACDKNWGIGLDNALPWRCPEDLKLFKKRTMGKHVLIGRRTLECLPNELEGRFIHCLSNNPQHGMPLPKVLKNLGNASVDEVLIAGGGAIYRECLHTATHAEISRIKGDFVCDTFMPNLDAVGWKMNDIQKINETLTLEYWSKS
jgi:dihydrofolate reductase